MAGGNGVNIGVAAKDQMGPNQLCNGVGEGRQCYNFTAAFRESFNSWHVSRSPAPAAPSRHSARSLLCHDPTSTGVITGLGDELHPRHALQDHGRA